MNKCLEASNITVITNLYLDLFFLPHLKDRFGGDCAIHIIPFMEYHSEENLDIITKSDYTLIWLNYDYIYYDTWNRIFARECNIEEIAEDNGSFFQNVMSDLLEQSNGQIIWFLFENYNTKFHYYNGYNYYISQLIDRINIKLYDKYNEKVCFIDLKFLIASVGIQNAYDFRRAYQWNALYSEVLLNAAIEEVYKEHLIYKGKTKKCIVLDCDNVLWGGILSEDGTDNIKIGYNGIGRFYQDFQRYLLSLYYSGAILTVCSKNDLSSVLNMFRNHSEMILKEDVIAHFEVNWENKPDNIRKIAKCLNISLESMVFIDDSPIEIGAVKEILPQVTTVLFQKKSIFNQLSCFNLKNNVNIENIKKRTETYQTNEFREQMKSRYNNYEEYINNLNLNIDIHAVQPLEISRFSELTQRTNKCTNGMRYSVDEVRNRMGNDQIQMYSVYVSDRFSDLGLVGAMEITSNTLTIFSLSCRALGRNIEQSMLEFISKHNVIRSFAFTKTYQNDYMIDLFNKYLYIETSDMSMDSDIDKI